jgi:hypothetical protein
MNQRLRRTAERLAPGALVRVSWVDADGGSGGWCTPEEALEAPPTVVTSTGVVVGYRHGLLVLAGDTDGENIHSVGRIPVAWLLTIEVIA